MTHKPSIPIVAPSDLDYRSPRDGDAGIDLIANETIELPAWEWVVIGTGLKVAIPEGHVGLVRGRSGKAFKERLFVFHGTIDSSYRGEIKVLISWQPSHSSPVHKMTRLIQRGDRIAQLVIVPFLAEQLVRVETLDSTERGEQGFGSTGG